MRRWQYGGEFAAGRVAGRDTCRCTGCVCRDVRQYDRLDGRALALTVDRRREAGRKVVGRNPPGLVLNRLVLNRPFEIGHSFSGPFRGTVILRGSIVTQRIIIVMIIILRNCRGTLFDLPRFVPALPRSPTQLVSIPMSQWKSYATAVPSW